MGLFTRETIITSYIEIITNLKVISNWQTVVNLCAEVNSVEDGPREAARALRKKLRLGTPQQQMNAITINQALIDCCGSRYKAQLATAKFAEEISHVLLSHRTDHPVKARLMERLAIWAIAFSQDPSLTVIPDLYRRMLEAGVLHNINPVVHSPSPVAARAAAPHPPPVLTAKEKMMQIFQDIGLANNIAHMLVEAVSFADPELEAIEENELILEFHSKCITLHRGIQIYLTEVTEAPIPNEKCLTSLLACNEELVMAFTAYDNMIERCRSTRTVRANQSIDVTAAQQASGLQHIHNKTSDMLIQRPIAIDEGSGVGSGYTLMDSINSKSKGVSQSPKLESYAGPFANDLYRISEPGDVSTAIRNGKRPDTHQEALSSSEKDAFSEQERELIQLIKDQSLQDIGRIGSSSSSAAAPSTTPVSPVK